MKRRVGEWAKRRAAVLVGLALLALLTWPVVRAVSQNPPALAASEAQSPVPTQLARNGDGTVTVQFRGEAGATYQIFYADQRAARLEDMQWTLAADGIVATEGWTQWRDAGDANRPAPSAVAARYYRVVRRAEGAPAVGTQPSPTPAPSAPVKPATSTEASVPSSPQAEAERRLARLQELEEIGESVGALLGGGPAAREQLAARLAASSLTVAELIQLGLREHHDFHYDGANVFYETVLGAKAAAATVKERADAHTLLGESHWSQGRAAEALAHFEQADALLDGDAGRGFTKVAQMYCLLPLGRYDEVRERFAQLQELPACETPDQYRDTFREYGLWMVSQSYCKQKRCAESVQALEEMSQSKASAYQMVANACLSFCRKHAHEQEQARERERQTK